MHVAPRTSLNCTHRYRKGFPTVCVVYNVYVCTRELDIQTQLLQIKALSLNLQKRVAFVQGHKLSDFKLKCWHCDNIIIISEFSA